MLNVDKFNKLCRGRNVDSQTLAGHLARGGFSEKKAFSAVENWKNGLFKPVPKTEDLRKLAGVLGVDVVDVSEWRSSYRYAPGSATKARLVTSLIVGRGVQDALDILKFTRKRSASMISKVLKAAIADADEQQADIENLYVNRAWVDDAGVRLGTKRWIPKDRGRAHPIRKKASHIHVSVTEA